MPAGAKKETPAQLWTSGDRGRARAWSWCFGRCCHPLFFFSVADILSATFDMFQLPMAIYWYKCICAQNKLSTAAGASNWGALWFGSGCWYHLTFVFAKLTMNKDHPIAVKKKKAQKRGQRFFIYRRAEPCFCCFYINTLVKAARGLLVAAPMASKCRPKRYHGLGLPCSFACVYGSKSCNILCRRGGGGRNAVCLCPDTDDITWL